MKRGVPALTEQQRRARDRAIIVAYCADEHPAAIALEHRCTTRLVRQIVAKHGLSKPVGRPSVLYTLNEDDRRDYVRLRRVIGAEKARVAVLGGDAA